LQKYATSAQHAFQVNTSVRTAAVRPRFEASGMLLLMVTWWRDHAHNAAEYHFKLKSGVAFFWKWWQMRLLF